MKLVYSVVMSAIRNFDLREPLHPSPVLKVGHWNKREIFRGNNIDCFFGFAGTIREKYGENVLSKKWSVMRLSLNQKRINTKNKNRRISE